MASNDKKTIVKNEDSSNKNELIKRFKANPFIFIGTFVVLIIVIIAFVLVPAIVPGAADANIAKLTFGKWDKTPIVYTGNNYFSKMREQYSRYAEVYRLNDYQVWLYSYQSTVVRTAILDIMQKSKYDPPAELIDKRVAELPDFQENGRFSAVRYNEIDPARRLALWQDVRNDTIATRYIDDIFTIQYSKAESDFIGGMASNQRKFKMVSYPYEKYPDSEIAAFVEKNPDLFRLLHLSQISINSDELDARKVWEAVSANPASFEDTARSRSEDNFSERGGDAGTRYFFDLVGVVNDDADRRSLLSLIKGSISPVYKTPSGWAFFRAEENAVNADTKDAAALERIRAYMMDSERGAIEDWLVEQAESFAARAKIVGFESAAVVRNLQVSEFGPLPINYGDAGIFATLSSFSAPELQSAAYNDNFWKTAWSTPIGQPSAPIVVSGSESSVIVIYPVEEISGDETAAENSSESFLSYWAENEKSNSIESTIVNSSKFSDNFFSTYIGLFSNLQGF
ncbi:hypothetical protein AGMMS50212_01160 [Spirochaetia bacterium]|nr:hypothetical protein AGMMS50212_01160 [Spirochaetia bacterium]